MSVQHKEDSIRNLRLVRLGIKPPDDWTDIAQVREAKKEEIGLACSAAIYAGIDVGGKHFKGRVVVHAVQEFRNGAVRVDNAVVGNVLLFDGLLLGFHFLNACFCVHVGFLDFIHGSFHFENLRSFRSF